LAAKNRCDPITDKQPVEIDRVAHRSILKQNPSQYFPFLNISIISANYIFKHMN
jgi:hypothetical protein